MDGQIDVSVLVPVLNEASGIRAAVDAMRAQRFSGQFELLLVDGGSDDGTRELLEEMAAGDPRLRVLDNPERFTPQALNVGLRAARGRYIARMDAHTFYPPDYLEVALRRLERGDYDWVAGPALPQGVDPGTRRTELALQSRLGVGGALFRSLTTGEAETDTGFTGLMQRETLERLGGWDEGWPVNQDSEIAARLRKSGGRIVCVAGMAAGYVPRGTLRGLARQYWRYGQYRVKTSVRHPESMRRSHLVPPALGGPLAGAALPGRLGTACRAGAALYAAAVSAESVRLGVAHRRPGDAIRLPAVFATMHVAWGVGFIAGSGRFGPPLRGVLRAIRPPGA